MTETIINGIKVLTPDEGKYLTNGETYSQKVYLGKNGSPSDWREVDSIPDEDEDVDPELTAEEALSVIMGGGV